MVETSFRIPEELIPDDLRNLGRGGDRARVSESYASYVLSQISIGRPILPYGGKYGGRDAASAEAYASYVVGEIDKGLSVQGGQKGELVERYKLLSAQGLEEIRK